ncbi:hypothetical protein H4Q26_015637 [Puccinia striiformis f. sp. tritici PST-130]|nr:hypothetical protein H4Q26_015637 [Puccinia striiformis f. sp. tritici PST-130]
MSLDPHIIKFASPSHHQEIFYSNIHPSEKMIGKDLVPFARPAPGATGSSDKTTQGSRRNSNSVMICGTSVSDKDNDNLSLTVMKVVHETIELGDVTIFQQRGQRLIEDSKCQDVPPPKYRLLRQQIHVVDIGGYLRMISLGYLSTILCGLLKSLDELGIGHNEHFAIGPARLKSQEVVNLIGLAQLLCIKPTKLESTHNLKDNRYIQKINCESFVATWKSKLPESFSNIKSLIVIPIDKLSLEPKIRMSQLFEFQAKWKIDEIERFLLPVTGGGLKKKFDELVLKFCRKIKEPTIDPNSHSKQQNSKDSKGSETIWLTARNNW